MLQFYMFIKSIYRRLTRNNYMTLSNSKYLFGEVFSKNLLPS